MPTLLEILNAGSAYRQRKSTEAIDQKALKPYKKALSQSNVDQLIGGLSGMAAGVLSAPNRMTGRAAADDIDQTMRDINTQAIDERQMREHASQYGATGNEGDTIAQLIGYGVPTARVGSIAKMSEAIPGFIPKAVGLAKDTLRNTATFAGSDYALSKAYGESDEVAKQNALMAGAIGAFGTPLMGAAHGLVGLTKQLPNEGGIMPEGGMRPNAPLPPEPNMPIMDQAKGVYQDVKSNVHDYFNKDTGSEFHESFKDGLKTTYGYGKDVADELSSTANKIKSFVKNDMIGEETAKDMFDSLQGFKDSLKAQVDEVGTRFKKMADDDSEAFVRTKGDTTARYAAQREADASITALKDKIKMLENDETGEGWLKELENQNTILFDATTHTEGSLKGGDRVRFTDEEGSVKMNQEYMDTLKQMIQDGHPAAQFMKDEIIREMKNQLKEHRITLKGIGIEAASGVKAQPKELTAMERRALKRKSQEKISVKEGHKEAAAEAAAKAEEIKYAGRKEVVRGEKLPAFEIKGLSEKGRTFRDSLDEPFKAKYDRMKELEDNIKLAEKKMETLSPDLHGKQRLEVQKMRQEQKILRDEINSSKRIKYDIENGKTPKGKKGGSYRPEDVKTEYKTDRPSTQTGSGKTPPPPPPKEPTTSGSSSVLPEVPKKRIKLDIDGKAYGVTLEDLAESTRYSKSNERVPIDYNPERISAHIDDIFVKPESFDVNHGMSSNVRGYFDSIMNNVHVKADSSIVRANAMLEAYMHESLHKMIKKAGMMDDIKKLEDDFGDDFIFTGSNREYGELSKAERIEEELVHYAAMKRSEKIIKAQNKDADQILLTDKRFQKLGEFEKRILSKNQAVADIVKDLDATLYLGTVKKGSFLNKALHGDSGSVTKTMNAVRDADNKIASLFPKMDDTKLHDNELLNQLTLGLKKGDKVDEFNDLMKQKKQVERDAVEKAGNIRDHITDLIKDPAVRKQMTHNVLRTDYHVIRDIKNKKDAIKAFIDMDTRLREIVGSKHDSIRQSVKLLAEGMRGELRALNNPKFYTNAYAIAVKNGLEPSAELLSIIDREASILAVNAKDGWKFIEENAGKKWFNEAVQITAYKADLGKQVMRNNPLNERKGYFSEMYDTPYVHEVDVDGNMIKKIDADLTYKEGAVPISGMRSPRGTKVVPLHDEAMRWTEEQKIAYAERAGFGVVIDTAGSIIKFRQHLMTEVAKHEAGLVDDFADVMAKSVGSSVKKIGLDDGLVPAIKDFIESGSSKLMSSEPRDSFVPVSEEFAKHLPFELQGTIKYVDPKFKHLLEGNIEVGYSGKNELLKVAQAVLKDTVVNFKENVVLKNPVSWMNAMMFNVSIGLQHGVSPKFMYRNMTEATHAYSQMRDVMKKMTIGMATGKYSDEDMLKMKQVLDNNLLYQLNKEGMTMTMLSDITSHPSFSSRLTDRLTYDKMKTIFGKDIADKASVVFKNLYLHPHSRTGQFATDIFTKIDVIGRYSMAKHKMSAEGMSAAEAAKFVNSVFGDFDTVLPKQLQYIQEFGAIPFAGWFYRVAGGLAKSAYDNPAKAIALFAGLYALQGESGKRTESWNPLATVINSPTDMVTMSPMLNYQNFAVNSKVPQMYTKIEKSDSPDDMILSNAVN